MKKGKTSRENRKNVRLNTRLLVKYTPLPGTASFVANIQNVSLGGLAFLTDHEIPPGTALRLRFVIPHKEAPVDAEGVIVRCPHDTRNTALFQAAVRFTGVTGEAEAGILELEAIIEKQKKTSLQ